VCAALAWGPKAAALPLTAHQKQLNLESFELIWSTIRDQYWDPKFGGLNWLAVHDELRPQMDRADTQARARAVMGDLLGRLGKSHFAIIPADLFGELEAHSGGGTAGLDVRVLEGRAIVTSVDESSPAAAGGVHAGWEILAIGVMPLAASLGKIDQLYRSSTMRELYLTRSVVSKLAGEVGSKVRVEFLDANNQRVSKELERVKPPGEPAHFGYLPTTYVWLRSRHLPGDIGYVTFNYFLNPSHLMTAFGDFVQSCEHCNGLIIDLRGNPGGLGVLAMGMAGWFIDKPGERLGTMHTREAPLQFVVNPRSPTYRGPVVILVDGASASTSEVFAEGMKDLGRARIFGTRSAGAALPSAIDQLPNGDAFQHALADYISEGGKSLEGAGVIPDVEVRLTREELLAGRDPVLDAAIEWIHAQK
jgi:carboxyl-terminal processing protease